MTEQTRKFTIQYKDENDKMIIVEQKPLAAYESGSIFFKHYDNEKPRVRYITYFKDGEVRITIDKPAYLTTGSFLDRDWIENLPELTDDEKKIAEIAKDYSNIFAKVS